MGFSLSPELAKVAGERVGTAVPRAHRVVLQAGLGQTLCTFSEGDGGRRQRGGGPAVIYRLTTLSVSSFHQLIPRINFLAQFDLL